MDNTLKPPVAANLRTLKDARGVTWREIAQALGAGERLVNGWASEEESDPSWFNVCRLAKFFNVEPWLFYVPPELVKSLPPDLMHAGETERLDAIVRSS